MKKDEFHLEDRYPPGDGAFIESPYYSKKERTLESALIYGLDKLTRYDYNLESEAGRLMLAKALSKAMVDNAKKTPWWYQRVYSF